MILFAKSCFIWVLSAILLIGSCYPVYADVPNDIALRNRFLTPELSATRKVKGTINLQELGLEDWDKPPTDILPESQLIELSIHLRDIARYLGSNWPIFITLPVPISQAIKANGNQEQHWQIIDFKNPQGNWLSITSGHILRMVVQELEIQKNSGEQPLLDFLVRNELTNSYKLLSNVPLSRYCYELLNHEL